MRFAPVFVDTGAWYALQVKTDTDWRLAQEAWSWLLRTGRPLLTTNCVVGETYTLFRYRQGFQDAWDFLELARRVHRLTIEHVSRETEVQAYTFLARYRDQPFSFVDATSFVVMSSLGIREAFAFDSHFATAGYARIGIESPLG